MRRVILFLFLSVVITSLSIAGEKQGNISFAKTSFNFGTFSKNQVRSCVFAFVNNGEAPVVINSVETACACTDMTYSRHAIKPGEKGYVTVFFNGNKASLGHFKKAVTIRSNAANGLVRLFIEGCTK